MSSNDAVGSGYASAVLEREPPQPNACRAGCECDGKHEPHEDHDHHEEHDRAHDHPAHDVEPECPSALDSVGSCACCAPKQEPAHNHGHDHEHDHGHSHGAFSWTWRIIVPGVLFALGLAGRHWFSEVFVTPVFYAVMLAAYALCGIPVLKDAGRALLRRDFFNEFTLMSMASLIAIAIGETAEAVGVMLFYSLGEAVQELAAGKSRRSIKSLLASKPESANVMRDGRVVPMRLEDVEVGSSVLVKPGEKVPLDGVVLSGAANMDMSSLTGEAVPVAVEQGRNVYSGAICLDGDLVVETTAGYRDSMVGKILAMVENAVAMKSKTERFITVFARYYTPVVVAAAVLVALAPPLLFAQPWSVWIYRALVLLVVSCPCALLLSVPLAFFAGIGTASRHGMLVKGGQVFDALARARAVVFDKTGTLTTGTLSLASIEAAPGVDDRRVLRLAALAESRSMHPVAKAVLEAAGDAEAFHQEVATRNVAGKGIVARSGEGEILVGNAALMADYGVEVEESLSDGPVAHVALDGHYQGRLTFSDRIKPDAAEAMRLLRENGVQKLYMLTGDREAAAASVATAMGLDDFRAGLLPDGKVAAFRELSPDGDAVFVGDGVNDAPVLAASGVGVAMGALGSAAAVEAADAVILDDSPVRLPQLFRIASRTRSIAGQNIAFALLIKAAIMVVGVLGYTGLWMAVFADVGVALLAVANSMRLTRD